VRERQYERGRRESVFGGRDHISYVDRPEDEVERKDVGKRTQRRCCELGVGLAQHSSPNVRQAATCSYGPRQAWSVYT